MLKREASPLTGYSPGDKGNKMLSRDGFLATASGSALIGIYDSRLWLLTQGVYPRELNIIPSEVPLTPWHGHEIASGPEKNYDLGGFVSSSIACIVGPLRDRSANTQACHRQPEEVATRQAAITFSARR